MVHFFTKSKGVREKNDSRSKLENTFQYEYDNAPIRMSIPPIRISNIKISTKIKAIKAHALKNLCEKNNVEYKNCGNFIIFQLSDENNQSTYTYTIFMPASENQEKVHTNICGLKEGDAENAIYTLQVFLNYPHENISYDVDTVTATVKQKHKVNLRKFLKRNLSDSDNEIKFNPESFPALYCKRAKITYSIFSSGVINILGAKSKKAIESDIDYILEKCLESKSENV